MSAIRGLLSKRGWAITPIRVRFCSIMARYTHKHDEGQAQAEIEDRCDHAARQRTRDRAGESAIEPVRDATRVVASRDPAELSAGCDQRCAVRAGRFAE